MIKAWVKQFYKLETHIFESNQDASSIIYTKPKKIFGF